MTSKEEPMNAIVPAVAPFKVYPSGSRNPGAAIIICPCCAARHWVPVNVAAPLHICPNTGAQFTLLLHSSDNPVVYP